MQPESKSGPLSALRVKVQRVLNLPGFMAVLPPNSSRPQPSPAGLASMHSS